MQESFGGEYNCLLGDRLWEDPHCCAAYIRTGSLDKEAAEEHMYLSCTNGGSGSAGELKNICILVDFIVRFFSFGKYLSLGTFSSIIWLIRRSTTVWWCYCSLAWLRPFTYGP